MDSTTTTPHYRTSNRCWAVLAGCCIMCAIGFAIPVTCWTVLMTPLINDTGITYTQAAMYMTMATLFSVVSLVLAPRLIKLGVSKVVAISGVVTSCGFFLIAAAPSAATVAVAGAIVGISYMLTSLYTAPVIIKNWFAVRQGTMTAIAMAFVGVGGVIFSPVANGLITAFGWRSAMITLGVICAVGIVLTSIFLIRLDPLPLGILPYGATEEEVLAVADKSGKEEDRSKLAGITFGASFKTPVAWLMLVVFLGLGAMATVTTNVNPMYQKFGFTASAAALALSGSSLGNITGKLVMGWASDKRGAQFGCLVASIMAIAGFIGYIISFTIFPNEVFLCISAFVCGNGCCMATMMPPLVSMDAFGPKDYDRIYGFFSAIRALMAAVMSIMVGMMVDASGSYMSTIIFWIAACVILVPFAYLGIKSGQKRWKKADTVIL